ncbi:DUF4917 family protein [Aeromonas jandaei]|uniref:DUF4917 family protein n=1 Tax=Aeromonas jandaei TaxID=650 RepID=UPI00191CABBE|nr:DUF4917 family protein [Aeromonas jandaei]MBL0628686.1 DUF4917 family protein [Aeromonas jandaei]
MQIYQWSELEGHFQSSLLLGNGSSIAIDKNFIYGTLKEQAFELGFLTKDIQQLFTDFETEDFEKVLNYVWQANYVNKTLGVHDTRTEVAYHQIRQCLIETVRHIHPERDAVLNDIKKIREFTKTFKTILSLNYDLILYWAIMYGNELHDGHIYKDCFNSTQQLHDDWAEMRKPYNARQRDISLVFYPHGNLVLYKDHDGLEFKNRDGGNGLLNAILTSWETGSFSPLFVSECSSVKKIASILSSNYLSTVYKEVIPSLENDLTIYGMGFNDNDMHILSQIRKSKINKIAISVYNQDADFIERSSRAIKKLWGEKFELAYFDSSSKGCWNNA